MKGRWTVILGIVMIFLSTAWFCRNRQESDRAAVVSMEVVPELQQIIPEQSNPEEESAEESGTQMPEQIIDGISYVGVLEIPALDLKLPVIGSWSENNAKIAPCRFDGTVYQDDLILCAHNYASHFGKLSSLTDGDDVAFTDVEGNQFYYQMREIEIMNGKDVAKIYEGDWELTLFTCTYGGKNRLVVRCERVKTGT